MVGGLWVVSAKIKDQHGLMKDWVREGDRDRDIDSERGIGMREG